MESVLKRKALFLDASNQFNLEVLYKIIGTMSLVYIYVSRYVTSCFKVSSTAVIQLMAL